MPMAMAMPQAGGTGVGFFRSALFAKDPAHVPGGPQGAAHVPVTLDLPILGR